MSRMAAKKTVPASGRKKVTPPSGYLKKVGALSQNITLRHHVLVARRHELIEEAATQIECPQCGAGVGHMCENLGQNKGVLKNPHDQRVALTGIRDKGSTHPLAADLAETLRQLDIAERHNREISYHLRSLRYGKTSKLPDDFGLFQKKYDPENMPPLTH